jgi:hypothetical protein
MPEILFTFIFIPFLAVWKEYGYTLNFPEPPNRPAHLFQLPYTV